MPESAPAPAVAPAPTTQPAQQSGTGAGQKPGESPAQAEARMLKRRMGDREVEIPESEVWANYEKGRNSAQLLSKVEQRRQEALKAKAEADGLLGRLKSEPLKALRELGVDVRALSERTILDEIELEKMSPAEKRAYEAEQKVKAFETEKQKAEAEKAEAVRKEEIARHQDTFSNLFLDTMEATGLPKQAGRFVAYRMAHLYQQNEEAGLESTPEEMAAHVMQGLQTEHRGVLSGLKGPPLLEYLGPDVVKAVLGAHLEGVRTKRGMPTQPTAPRQAPAPAAPMDPRKGRWEHIDRLIKGQ